MISSQTLLGSVNCTRNCTTSKNSLNKGLYLGAKSRELLAENGGFEESKILLNEVTVSSVKPGWSLEAYPSFYSGKTWYF